MSDSTKPTTLLVNGHRVPVTAYKRIVERWRSGWAESEITQEAMSTMRNDNIGVIGEVVLGAVNDQRFAFAFPSEPTGGDYFCMPLDSPNNIRKAQLALQKTKADLALAESIEDENTLEAMMLMEIRPTFIDDAKTHSERVRRQTHVDQMTKNALQKRQKAEEDCLHLKEIEESTNDSWRFRYVELIEVSLPIITFYNLDWPSFDSSK